MSEANQELTPREIVKMLDADIVGQDEAKRAVAIAVRNRWRRKHLPKELQQEVSPKNILMIGPTGVGKTEIARRLAKLTGAPFIKVEATKFTEVGYYGRDVESMVRELVDNAIGIVRETEREAVQEEAKKRAERRLLDQLISPRPALSTGDPDEQEKHERSRQRMKEMLEAGQLEDRTVELTVEQKGTPMMIGGMGMEQMDMDLQGMLEKIMPKHSSRREMTVAQARTVLIEQETEALLDKERIYEAAIDLAENVGMIFLDEIDKIVAGEGKAGTDVSRQGVQRDLLPIVEGTTVQTKYGYVNTDHVMFVAAGAFHKVSPSDLMPELQGRFPIRVELSDLTKEDFVRILTEPKSSLTRQYVELMKTEEVAVRFTADALEEIASYAFQINQTTQNIGARRLYTIMERLLEELSFEAPDMKYGTVEINAAYVRQRLDDVSKDEDLSRFIL